MSYCGDLLRLLRRDRSAKRKEQSGKCKTQNVFAHHSRLTPFAHGYLITRSALANTLGGIVRPICLAVLRLMMNSTFVACSTGSSAGFAPFRILSTYLAAPRDCSKGFGPYDMRPPASVNTLSGYIVGNRLLAERSTICVRCVLTTGLLSTIRALSCSLLIAENADSKSSELRNSRS